MAMVSMNVKDDDQGAIAPGGYDPCPCIYLNAAQCKALGISTPPRAGMQMTLTAVVEVESVTETDDDDADDADITLRLSMEYAQLGPAPSGSKANLYPDAD
jgi:hypothetical protein